MATKKQQRRRAKERRHEYEYVYVDEQGNEVEVEVEPEELEPARTDKAGKAKAPVRRRGGRPVREVKPPSWSRVSKRALIFAPLMYIALSIGKHPPAVATRIAIALAYTVLFVPMFFWIERIAYRRYLRQTGRSEPPKRPGG